MATEPCPQSLIGFDADQAACPSTWQVLYAGACNCDAGFWCGCLSSDPFDCYPGSNNSLWFGQYTNSTGVHSRNASVTKCNDTSYCPGDKDPHLCPMLCPVGHFCETPASASKCPSGTYCPIGSVSPRECPRLSNCPEGSVYFSSWPLLLLVALICVLSYSFSIWRRGNLVQGARSRKIAAVSRLAAAEERAHGHISVKEALNGSEHSGGPDVGLSNTADAIGPSISFSSFKSAQKSVNAKLQTVHIEFEGLRLTLSNGGPTLLSEVNGSIPAGKITAVMGPSGAGKTTFLNVMAGKVQRTGGSVYVNGVEADLEEYKGIIGFVPQDDTMLRELTVEEVITHSAYMRLPADMPREEKDEAIRDIIDSLGLTHVQDSVIGDELRRGVSGGQRKRVSVGIEIVTKPSFLCLDEPTSGLDSVASLSLVKALKELATQGVTIVAVLHQPKYDIFALFDNVLLLGVGGCTVYLGPANEMKQYFEGIGFSFPPSTNPADYCMDIIAGLVEREGYPNFVKEDLFDLWKERCSKHSPKTPEEPTASGARKDIEDQVKRETAEKEEKPDDQGSVTVKSEDIKYTTRQLCGDLKGHMFRNMQFRNKFRSKISFFEQFKLLFYRCVLQRLHTLSMVPLWMALLAGALIGIANRSTSYEGIPNVLLDSEVGQAFLSQNINVVDGIPPTWSQMSLAIVLVCVPGIEVFGLERAIFFREASTGLHITAYWLAKILETIVWIPLYSLVFSAVIYSLSPFYLEFYRFWLTVLMAYIGYYATGMIVSTKVSQANRGIVALIAGLILTFAFSGVAIKYGDSHVQGLFWLFFPFWTAQAFVASEYEQRSIPYDVGLLNDPNADIKDHSYSYGYDLDSSFARDIGFALLTAITWHIILLFFLKFSDWKKHR